MKLRAIVRDPESIERFLRHQDLWSPACGSRSVKGAYYAELPAYGFGTLLIAP
jgi:hypothetical protein